MSKRAATRTTREKTPSETSPGRSRRTNGKAPPVQSRPRRERAGRRPTPPAPSPFQVLGRVPRTAWVCALLAVLNAVGWSILIPPLQGPDEQAHFAYTQLLAENRQLPSSSEENFSPEELAAMSDLEFGEVILNPGTPSVPTRARQRRLQRDLSQPLSRKGSDGSAGTASSQPPLYYALEMIPYALGSGSTLLDRLELMRLLSALLAGFTVVFVFLFLREALPAVPWAWTVGTMCAALSPLLGFVGGSVDPDALFFVVATAMFYCFARAFRRGLSRRLAVVLGALIATGLVTKVNFIGLLPGIGIGLLVLGLREARISKREAWISTALAGAIGASPAMIYVLINLATHRATLGIVTGAINNTKVHGSLGAELTYIWQLYLPRLPGMTNDFPGIFPPLQIWFKGIIGRYNWLETVFPGWVYTVALIPAAPIAGLCLRELHARRAELGRRLPELCVYLALTLGLMLLIGGDSYVQFPTLAAGISEPRYFLPLLALGSALLALAARGAGRRWGPVAGVAIVMLILAHNILSQMLEVSRFYHP